MRKWAGTHMWQISVQRYINAYTSFEDSDCSGSVEILCWFFYRASIESVTTWFGNLTVKYKSQILRLVRMTGKIMDMVLHFRSPPQIIFEQSNIKLARKILLYRSHVLNSEYEIMHREEDIQYFFVDRYKKSLIPQSIKGAWLLGECGSG